MYKCLSVLTNQQMVAMALLPSSFVRELTEEHIEKESRYNALMKDVATRYEDFTQDSELMNLLGDHDYIGDGKELLRIMYEGDNFIDTGDLGVELTIDQILSESNHIDFDSDRAVLLTWLERLLPAIPKADQN